MLELSSSETGAAPTWTSTALPSGAPERTMLRVSSLPAPLEIVMADPPPLSRNESRTATPAVPLTPTAGEVSVLGATMTCASTLGVGPLPVKLIVPVTMTPGASVAPLIVTPESVKFGASS